jgi:hypothetical protein
MKKRVYIETTVVSYFAARPSRDIIIAGHQEATRDLWPDLITKYDTYISALSYEEARTLANRIVGGRGISPEYPEDALHISVAAVNGIDVLITWNFAHLNNPFTRKAIRRIVEDAGYACPEICSPEELLEVNK